MNFWPRSSWSLQGRRQLQVAEGHYLWCRRSVTIAASAARAEDFVDQEPTTGVEFSDRPSSGRQGGPSA